jgi:hypothetical protein
VLAGKRAAEADHHIGRLLDKRPVIADAGGGLQIEVDARMHAALTEVAVQVTLQLMRVEEPAEFAQILPQLLGRDRRVFPPFPRRPRLVDVRGCAEAGLAHLPHLLFLAIVVKELHRRWLRQPLEVGHQFARARVALGFGVAAELDDQPSLTLRQHFQGARFIADRLDVLHQTVVHALAADRPVGHDLGDVIGGFVHARIAEHHERPGRRVRDQMQRRLEDQDAGTFAAHEGLSDVEAVLGKQRREIEPGNAARDVGNPSADVGLVSPRQLSQAAVDLAAPPRLGREPLQLVFVRRADAHPDAVVREDVQRLHVVGGARAGAVELRHHGMHAAGIVADHAAERAVCVRRRIGPERQPVPLGGVPQIVEDGSGLYACAAAPGVDLQHAVHVFREIEADGDIAALARQAGAAATAEHGRPIVSACRQRALHVFDVAGNDDADRRLPVIGPVGRVQRAAAAIEPDFSFHRAAQIGRQTIGLDGRCLLAISARRSRRLFGQVNRCRHVGVSRCLRPRSARRRAV